MCIFKKFNSPFNAGPCPPKGWMGYSPRPPAVKGPPKGEKSEKREKKEKEKIDNQGT